MLQVWVCPCVRKSCGDVPLKKLIIYPAYLKIGWPPCRSCPGRWAQHHRENQDSLGCHNLVPVIVSVGCIDRTAKLGSGNNCVGPKPPITIHTICSFALIGLLITIYVEIRGTRARSCPGARVWVKAPLWLIRATSPHWLSLVSFYCAGLRGLWDSSTSGSIHSLTSVFGLLRVCLCCW